jgi:hypothetical protein
VTGAGYARVAATFGASSGAVRSLSAAVNLTIPTGVTVSWLGFWNGATYLGYSPNAANPKEFIVDPSTGIFTCSAHGYVNTNTVVVYADTMPTGLTEGTVYFIVNATANTFQLSATSGGAAIAVSSVGGSACVVSTITQQAYAGGGTHTISTWTLALPD